MQLYEDNAQDLYGNARPSVSVLVSYEGSPATIYSDNGVTPKANPLTTGAGGSFSFYAANGVYTLTAGEISKTVTLFDSTELATAGGAALVGGTWFGGVVATVAALATSVGASLLGFIQAGVGAVLRSIQDKLRDHYNVKDFGVLCDGSLETTAVQAAVDAVSLAGGGVLTFPNGTCSFGLLALKANVTLRGKSLSAVLRMDSSISTSNSWITVDGVSDAGIERLTIDVNSNPGSDGNGPVAIVHKTTSAAADNLKVKGNRFRGGVIRPYYNNVCSIVSRGVTIEDNEFIGKDTLTLGPAAPNFRSTQALRFLPTATGSGNWRILKNRAKYCGIFIQIRHGTAQDFDKFDTVTVHGNQITDVLDDSNVSSSPYELFCITGLAVTGNTIYSGGRGFNATYCKNAVYTGNTAYDQTAYFFELQSSDGVSIVGNNAYNCRTFVNDTTSGASGSRNVFIRGNNVVGGSDGEVDYNYQTMANIVTMVSGISGYANWQVCGNTFSGLKWASAVIRIDGTDLDGYVCEDNTIIMTEETQVPLAINYVKGKNVSIKRNKVYASQTFGDDAAPTSSISAIISIGNSGGAASDTVYVEYNTINWTGTDGRTSPNDTGVIGIGINAVAAAAPTNLVVRHNKLSGAFTNPVKLPITAGDTVYENNDLLTATGTSSIDAAIVYRRTRRVAEATAAPTAGIWTAGDTVWNTSPNGSNGIIGWMCTASGTPGTWATFASANQMSSLSVVGDADATITPLSSRNVQYFNTALTTNRTVTLSTTGAYNGLRFRVVRTAAATGASTIDVGGLKTLTAAGQWCEVVYNGSAYVLIGYGTL
jgi:hypothetical protein